MIKVLDYHCIQLSGAQAHIMKEDNIMKKWNKILSVAVVSAMVVSMMTGCSDSNAAANGESGSQPSSSANAGTPAEGTSGAGVFKIGGIGPTTGEMCIRDRC